MQHLGLHVHLDDGVLRFILDRQVLDDLYPSDALELEERRSDEDLEGLKIRLALVVDAVMTHVEQLAYSIVIFLREGVLDGHDNAVSRRVAHLVHLQHVRRDAQVARDSLGHVQFTRPFTCATIHQHCLHRDLVVHRDHRKVAELAEVDAAFLVEAGTTRHVDIEPKGTETSGRTLHCGRCINPSLFFDLLDYFRSLHFTLNVDHVGVGDFWPASNDASVLVRKRRRHQLAVGLIDSQHIAPRVHSYVVVPNHGQRQ